MATETKVAQAPETTTASQPAQGSREHYEAWQAEQRAFEAAEATGSPELVALRKLARTAEHVFEFEGLSNLGRPLTPAEILGEAVRCARSDFSVIGDAASVGSGMVDSMVFRRAELRLDLALALAEYRAAFSGDSAAAEVSS